MTNLAPKKSNKVLWIVLILIVVLVVLPGLCCVSGFVLFGWGARRASHSIQSGTAVEVLSGGSMSVNRLPANFPSDLPQYPGAKMTFSIAAPDKSKADSGSVLFSTSDSTTAVTDFYSRKLTAAGWTQEMSMATGKGAVTQFKKANRGISVVVSGDTPNTISLTYTTDKAENP